MAYLDRVVPLLDGDRGQEAIDPVLNALPSLDGGSDPADPGSVDTETATAALRTTGSVPGELNRHITVDAALKIRFPFVSQ